MEEKKINELTDEALDAITGGATYEYDSSRLVFWVYDAKNNKVNWFATEDEAKNKAAELTRLEGSSSFKSHGNRPVPKTGRI